MKASSPALFRFVCVLTGLLLCGCRTTSMKGTPTLSGEWEQREGPVENRIMLWPFLYYREPALSVMWPIFEKTPDHVALRPFYSVRGLESGRKVHRVLWPLGEFDTHTGEWYFFPVFGSRDSFVVFPVYWHWGEPFGSGGLHSLFPLWIYSRDPGGRHRLNLLWPLVRFERAPDLRRDRVVPLFSAGDLAGRERWFYSLPYGWHQGPGQRLRYAGAGLWGRSETPGGRHHWLLPFFIRHDGPEETGALYSLPWFRLRNAERRVEGVPLLLSWRVREEGREDLHLLGPLARISRGEEAVSSYLFPFWHRSADGRTMLTPVYQRGHTAAGTDWWSVLPLYYQQRNARGAAWITPLGGMTRNADGTGRTVTPLYARVEDRPGHVMHAVPPLLSWRTREPGLEDQRWLLGLIRLTRGERGGASHVLPIYYHNPRTKTHVNPFWATWTEADGTRNQMVPLLLSGSAHNPGADEHRVHAALGLYGRRSRISDGETLSSHLFPLYARREDGSIFTPVYGRDAKEGGTFQYLLTPLAGTYRNARQGGWIFPLFDWRQDRETGDHNSRFLLWGRHQSSEGHRSTRMFPLFSATSTRRPVPASGYARHTAERDSFSLFLLYLKQRTLTLYGPQHPRRVEGESFQAETREIHRLFPLWDFRAERLGDGPSLERRQVLWRLYDQRREHGSEAKPHDYVRHRLLWRVWHYERLNGDVSVDALPFITYDRKTDGYRRFAFLWRAFRYENHPEEGRKIDFLFIPLKRGSR